MKRRKFLKLAGAGSIVFGSGLLGVPLGACRVPQQEDEDPLNGGDDPRAEGTDPVDLSDLDDLSPEEVEDFLADVDTAGDTVADLVDDLGRPRIPPGQRVLETIPVLGQNPDPRDMEEWTFTVRGEVEHELELTWEDFAALEHVDQTCDLHCVTGWTALDTQWKGVRVATLLEMAGATDQGRFVVFDCERGYTTNLSIEDARQPNVLIATELYGNPLPSEYGGLARGLVPDRYLYKSGKWVTGLRVLADDEPGYWERRGYSNTADPWTEDRYS